MEPHPRAPAVADHAATFKTQPGKAAGLAILMGALAAACIWAGLDRNATVTERSAGLGAAALFAWGLLLALMRLADRRPVIVVDADGVRDRRTKVDARWPEINGARVWVQEADIARVPWIALDVANVERVRKLHPLWAQLRRASLERWGRPAVLLNLQGLEASPEDVLAAIESHRTSGVQARPGSLTAE